MHKFQSEGFHSNNYIKGHRAKLQLYDDYCQIDEKTLEEILKPFMIRKDDN